MTQTVLIVAALIVGVSGLVKAPPAASPSETTEVSVVSGLQPQKARPASARIDGVEVANLEGCCHA